MTGMQRMWAVSAIGLAVYALPIVGILKMDESEAKANCQVAYPSNPVEAAKCAREVLSISRNQNQQGQP